MVQRGLRELQVLKVRFALREGDRVGIVEGEGGQGGAWWPDWRCLGKESELGEKG